MGVGKRSGTLCRNDPGIVERRYVGWKCQDVSSILAAVRKNVKNGSVILMHDEYAATVKYPPSWMN